MNILKVLLFLFALVIIFKLAPNYETNDSYAKNKINIIINNNNVTKKLKHDLYITDRMLERYCEYFSERYTIVTLEEAYDIIKKKRNGSTGKTGSTRPQGTPGHTGFL